MRAAASLLVLVGCNQVYGLDETRRVDAAYFDAGIDAPNQCPPLGSPPRFSQRFKQVVFQSCMQFGVARNGRTLARCRFPTGYAVAEGQIGNDMMVPARGFDTPDETYEAQRISPDGNTAIVHVRRASGRVFVEYVRGADAWSPRRDIVVAGGSGTSSVSASGHLLVSTLAGLQELVDDGTTFQPTIFHTRASLGLANTSSQLSITPDGLRLLVVGIRNGQTDLQLLYTDRAREGDPFAPAVPLPTVDYLLEGFMTEDCAHLYFEGPSAVFQSQPEQ